MATGIIQRTKDSVYEAFENGSSYNTRDWFRVFTISYTGYQYLHLRFIVYAGYDGLAEVLARLRFEPTGLVANATEIKIVQAFGLGAADHVIFYQINSNTYGLAIRAVGNTTVRGIKILDLASEAQGINNAIVFDRPFVHLDAAPTKFGTHTIL